MDDWKEGDRVAPISRSLPKYRQEGNIRDLAEQAFRGGSRYADMRTVEFKHARLPAEELERTLPHNQRHRADADLR